MLILGLALAAVAAAGCAAAQELAEAVGKTKVSMTLKNGQKIEGTLLKQEDGQSLVQVKYGSVTVTAGDVASVEKTGVAPVTQPGEGRLARWDHCIHFISDRPWSHALVQVPATVVDLGIFKNVPYFSHRSGDFEFNVYGDPDQPACLEIGLYNGGTNAAERKACLDTMLALLNDPADRDLLRSVNLNKGMLRRSGMVFEVTPPTDKDSYGGWWISVYDEKALDRQRASDGELASITVTRIQVKTGVRGPVSPVSVHGPTPASNKLLWQEHDLKMARPETSPSAESRVYKRGVHRKDGVYVVAQM
jgi:hypothetical protein